MVKAIQKKRRRTSHGRDGKKKTKGNQTKSGEKHKPRRNRRRKKATKTATGKAQELPQATALAAFAGPRLVVSFVALVSFPHLVVSFVAFVSFPHLSFLSLFCFAFFFLSFFHLLGFWLCLFSFFFFTKIFYLFIYIYIYFPCAPLLSVGVFFLQFYDFAKMIIICFKFSQIWL